VSAEAEGPEKRGSHEAGEPRESGVTVAADGAAGKSGAADGESDQVSGPESEQVSEPESDDVSGPESDQVSEPESGNVPGPESEQVSEPDSGKVADLESGNVPDLESDDPSDPEAQAEIVVRDAISAPDVDGRPRRATRRFPLFTRDTARPEGGGRAAPRDAPAPARQWPVLAVLATVGLGLLLTALDQFRYGTLLIGLALLAGAVLRWLLPDVGMLAVRSRFTDITTYGVLGTAIVLLAMMVQPSPWLVIPFLKDTLHFTVSSS
jgi:Protein of unknown function (DUF3017)